MKTEIPPFVFKIGFQVKKFPFIILLSLVTFTSWTIYKLIVQINKSSCDNTRLELSDSWLQITNCFLYAPNQNNISTFLRTTHNPHIPKYNYLVLNINKAKRKTATKMWLDKVAVIFMERTRLTCVSPTPDHSCFTKRGGVDHQYKIFWLQRYPSIALSRMSLQN